MIVRAEKARTAVNDAQVVRATLASRMMSREPRGLGGGAIGFGCIAQCSPSVVTRREIPRLDPDLSSSAVSTVDLPYFSRLFRVVGLHLCRAVSFPKH